MILDQFNPFLSNRLLLSCLEKPYCSSARQKGIRPACTSELYTKIIPSVDLLLVNLGSPINSAIFFIVYENLQD